ncbi:MAG: LPS export ABC transporter periplasmic protein LptC [Candidatus Omnitrophota bacterium]
MFPAICRAEEAPAVEQEVQQFSFTGYTKDGKKEWEVRGDSAVLEGEVATFQKPKLESTGETSFTVTSERGSYNRQTAQAHLEENVLAETNDGATLKTESLDWHGDSKKISTEDKVVIEKEAILSQGKGAEAYPDLNKFVLKEDVKVEMAPDVQITSKGPMELDYAKHIAVFQGEVKIIDREGEVLADRMDVHFDPETNQVYEVIAAGNVQIKRGDSISYSEKAIYDARLRKVTLTGKPKLYIRSEEEENVMADDPFLKSMKR